MNKNDIITLDIETITNEGCGLGRYNGMVVFVPFTAVGDKLRVKILKVTKTHCYGKIEEILTPSPDRIPSDCNVFTKCGGCAFRHISYEAELRAKDSFIRDAFTRIGGLNPIFKDIVPNVSVNRYRNKAQYPVGKDKDGNIICGFFADRSHRIVPSEKCMLEQDVFAEIRSDVIKFAAENKIPAYNEEEHSGILRHVCIRRGHYSGEINVVIVVRKNIPQLKVLARSLSEKFSRISGVVVNVNKERTNVIYGGEETVLYGEKNITDKMLEKKFSISPKSFYQVNTPMAEKLYSIAAELAEPEGKTVIDLYCGAGTIGLTMADKVKKLIGVEIVPSAVENAKVNAAMNNAEKAEFYCGDAGKITTMLKENGIRADVVIVDPARKGCDETTLNNICTFAPERIVMVSCNPVTAARDCSYLEMKGYSTVSVQGVDLFSRTVHVESVVLLSKVQN